MPWKDTVNATLARTAGVELRRIRRESPAVLHDRRSRRKLRRGDRLLKAPVFVMCTVRSGSTLLRVLMDSHSRIHSPHEMHLRDMQLTLRTRYAERSLGEVGLDVQRLEYLLWDRVLQRELAESGKEILVNKTPSDVFIADRIKQCWPDARFIHLVRHPGAIARSRHAARPQDAVERNARKVLQYGEALEAARQAHPGPTVRYEDLASDPAAVTRELCEFIGVRWEPEMLDYGSFDHGRHRPGLGDWSKKIKSGEVQKPSPPPSLAETPAVLHGLAVTWGYATAEEVAAIAPAPATPGA